jgi:opacity protein-like surface antigen
MKRAQLISLYLLSTVGALGLCGAAASAADLGAPMYKAPSPAGYNWTGFYVGANGGFGGDRFEYPFSFGSVPVLGLGPTTGTSTLNSSGFFGGGQVGFNWQAGQSLVLGVEADFDDADIKGLANTSANTFSGNVGTKLDWFGTVRGRVGFLVTPQALLYGTGGWAYGHTTSNADAAAFGLAKRLDRRRRPRIRPDPLAFGQDRVSLPQSRHHQPGQRHARRRPILAERKGNLSHRENRPEPEARRALSRRALSGHR